MSTVSALASRSESRIRPEHTDRAAVVYVRQSSRQQVLEHAESTRLRYALVERAVDLGWARSRVMVIDDDLGCRRRWPVGGRGSRGGPIRRIDRLGSLLHEYQRAA